jgi:hypothetical protein
MLRLFASLKVSQRQYTCVRGDHGASSITRKITLICYMPFRIHEIILYIRELHQNSKLRKHSVQSTDTYKKRRGGDECLEIDSMSQNEGWV